MSFGQQRSEQRSESGGPLSSVTGTNRAQVQNVLRDLLRGAAPGAASLAGQPFQSITPTPLDELGLFSGQRQAFNEAVNQAFSRASGSLAQRGFLRPEITPAIAGSAVQNVLPQFAPLMGQQIMGQDQFRQQLALAPEQVRGQRQVEFLNFLSALSQALGQQSTAFGAARGFQAGISGAGEAGEGIAALKCWIAEALYGPTDPRVALLRLWFALQVCHSWYGRIGLGLYERYGRQVAQQIPRSRWLRMLCRWLFDWLVNQAEVWWDEMETVCRMELRTVLPMVAR